MKAWPKANRILPGCRPPLRFARATNSGSPFASRPHTTAPSGEDARFYLRFALSCFGPKNRRFAGFARLFMQHQEKEECSSQRENMLLERSWFAGLFGRIV